MLGYPLHVLICLFYLLNLMLDETGMMGISNVLRTWNVFDSKLVGSHLRSHLPILAEVLDLREKIHSRGL